MTKIFLLKEPFSGDIHDIYIVIFIVEKSCIGGVMVSVLISSAVDREFEPRFGQTTPLSTQH